MWNRLPRWGQLAVLIIAAVIVVGLLAFGVYGLNRALPGGWGLLIALIILAALGTLVYFGLQPLLKLYRFNKNAKQYEGLLTQLPALVQAGRIQEAVARFELVMKDAPDSAYISYMRATFLQGVGRQPEALAAANKAMSLLSHDPYLPAFIKQGAEQPGAPKSLDAFKANLETMIDQLSPRVTDIRLRHAKAVEKRKKKSR